MKQLIEHLTNLFGRFPSIGPRQAKRFVYFLLGQDDLEIDALISALNRLKHNRGQCRSCYRFFANGGGEVCDLCTPTSGRDNTQLLVIEKDIDLENILKTGAYQGYFFVLGGNLPILEPQPETQIRLRELTTLIHELKTTLTEMILALSATTEGDHTAEYLKTYITSLPEAKNIKTSLLGRGLSTGSELEYADIETLKNALKNRS